MFSGELNFDLGISVIFFFFKIVFIYVLIVLKLVNFVVLIVLGNK